MLKKMKVLLTLFFVIILVVSFGEMKINDDGILVGESSEDWEEFFGDDYYKTGNICTVIGTTIMQMSYNKDGKGDKLSNPDNDVKAMLNDINEALDEMGEKNPKKGKNYLYESYYVKKCKKLTEADYKLANSKTFRDTFKKMFSTYGK